MGTGFFDFTGEEESLDFKTDRTWMAGSGGLGVSFWPLKFNNKRGTAVSDAASPIMRKTAKF